MKKIAVATPAGNIGRSVVRRLLELKVDVVLLGLEHHHSALEEPIANGAEFRLAASDDAQALKQATHDVSALFWLTPPNTRSDMRKWYLDTAEAASFAIQENGINRVVNLSSIGAGMRDGLGTVSYVGPTEVILNKSVDNIVHLRPGYFMENLLLQRDAIQNGTLAFPFSPKHDLPWISTKDIGDVAASYLIDETWAGKWTKHIMGPENLTPVAVADALTRVLGRRVNYHQLSYEDLAKSMIAGGMNKSAANDLVLTFKALGDEDGIYAMPRTPDAFTPTTIDDFARENFVGQRN